MSDSSFPQQFDRIRRELDRLDQATQQLDEIEAVLRRQERDQLADVLEDRLLELAQMAAQEKLFERLPYPEAPRKVMPAEILEQYPDTEFRVIGGKDLSERPGTYRCRAHGVVLGNEGSVWVLQGERRPPTIPESHTRPRAEPENRPEDPYWTTNLAPDRPAYFTRHEPGLSWLPWNTGREVGPFRADLFWEEDRSQPLEPVVEMVEIFQEGLEQARQQLREEIRERTEQLDRRKQRLDQARER